jgi:hypothetical protein
MLVGSGQMLPVTAAFKGVDCAAITIAGVVLRARCAPRATGE